MTSRKSNDPSAQYLNEIRMSSEKTARHGLADGGAKFIDDSAQHTEGFYAIQGINSAKLDVTDCVFPNSMTGFDADFVIPNGAIIYGDFSTLSLDSGSCIAYKK